MVSSLLVEDDPVPNISQFILRDQHVEFYKHVRRGLNGEVYFGKRIKLDDEVVYKFYLAQSGYDSTEEAVILKKIKHENILEIFDLKFLHPHFAYFVTPKISGGDLQETLDSRNFSTREVLNIIAGILKGLTELHSTHTLVHRDLKLGNILFDLKSNRPIIADLGSVKKIDIITGSTTASKSTFLYLPPEAILKGDYYFQSDIYQVGIMMFQLLGGFFPIENPYLWFSDKESKQHALIRNSSDRQNKFNEIIGKKIVKGCLANCNSLPHYLDSIFKKVLNKALNLSYGKRYQNTSLFLKEIHQLQRNCPDYIQEPDKLIIRHDCGKEFMIYKNRKNQVVLEKSITNNNWRKDNSHNGTMDSALRVARLN